MCTSTMAFSYWVQSVLVMKYFLINLAASHTSMSYCEGDTLKTLTHEDCSGGINFGDRKPDCVCMTGMYKIWLDNCILHDGFSVDGCSTLFTNSDGESIPALGMQLASGSIVQDYSNEILVAFPPNKTDYGSWSLFKSGQIAWTGSAAFYTVNSEAHLFTSRNDPKAPPTICIGKTMQKKEGKMCRHSRGANPRMKMWNPAFGALKVDITSKDCTTEVTKPEGYTAERIFPEVCFDIVTQTDSECSLQCGPHRTASSKMNEINPTSDHDDTENGSGTTSTTCPPPTRMEVQGRANAFQNRQLNQWSKLRQVGNVDQPFLDDIKPSKTIKLLDLGKQIAKKACSSKFVSPLFFDQGVDLFIILHNGRENRFLEDYDENDYRWTDKILNECNLDTKEIPLYADGDESGCTDFEKVEGYCKTGSIEANTCEKISLNISDAHNEFKHHFVVDIAWNIIDLLQSICLEKFQETPTKFHLWEQNSEKLFTREIKKLWSLPNVDKKVYQNLLTPTAIVDMFNFEMCIEAAYHMNPRTPRLQRLPEPSRMFRRRKRDATDDADRVGDKYDVFCRKKVEDFVTPC